MSRPIVFVDTETTALGHLARPWEIAVIRRDPDGTEVEYVWTVEYTPLGLPPGTDPAALEIGGWHDRSRGMGRSEYWERIGAAGDLEARRLDVGAGPEFAIARQVHALLEGAVLVGVGVHFDAAVLSAMFLRHGLAEQPWHYAILDLKAASWGWRRGFADWPGKSEELAAALDVEPPTDEERHTALGDARWAARWYDALTGGAE